MVTPLPTALGGGQAWASQASSAAADCSDMSPEEIGFLQKLLTDPSRRAEAARRLADEHRAAGRAGPLAEALEVLALVAPGPREEARVLSQLGRARLAAGEPEQALLALGRALYLAPDDPSLLAGLRDDAARADRSPQLEEVLRDLASDAPARARTLIEAELARPK
ncbi:MAG: hypothetical protein HY901_25330 [Deltaproteobacteria bacterium]|nr:hypothetical protein [Deltaproteobacteria bacterium]